MIKRIRRCGRPLLPCSFLLTNYLRVSCNMYFWGLFLACSWSLLLFATTFEVIGCIAATDWARSIWLRKEKTETNWKNDKGNEGQTMNWKAINMMKSSWLATSMRKREKKLTRSHLSTHLAWNSWEQGNTRSVWRGSKSQIQMTHDVWSPEMSHQVVNSFCDL